MRVAASDISTQYTSTHIAMKVTNYMTMKCTSSNTEPLGFWQQHSRRFPMLHILAELYLCMSSASIPDEAMFSTTGLILNGKRLMLTSSIELHSFMTITHTCLILNRQKTMNVNDLKKKIFQWHFHWFYQCGLDRLTLIIICPACTMQCIILAVAVLCEAYATWLRWGLFQYSNFQYTILFWE